MLNRRRSQPQPLTYAARLQRREKQRQERRRRRRVTVAAVVLALAIIVLAPLTNFAGINLGGAGSKASPSRAQIIDVTWGGDVAYDSTKPLPQDSYAGLSSIRSYLSAGDITLVNLEGTLGKGGATKCGGDTSGNCFGFQAPPEFAAQLGRAGVDGVNLANNHSYDAGPEGINTTIEALQKSDLGHAGIAGSAGFIQSGTGRIAILGLAAYPWAGDIRNVATIRSSVAAAARQANQVIVMLHGGREAQDATTTPVGSETAFGEDRGDMRLAARTAIDAGADLVVGSGPHVVRGMELYKERLIAYSAGNLAANDTLSLGGNYSVSALVRAKLGENGRLLSGKVIPLVLTDPGRPGLDPQRQAIEIMDSAARKDFGNAAVRIRQSGAMVVPR